MPVPFLVPGLFALGGVLGIGGITAAAEAVKNDQNNKAEQSALQVILADDGLTGDQKAVILAAMQSDDAASLVQFGDGTKQVEYIFVPGDNNTVTPTQQTTAEKTDLLSGLVPVVVPAVLCLGGLYLLTKGGK